MAGNSSFGRRGPGQASGQTRVPAGIEAKAPETALERVGRLPWRVAGLGVMACLLGVYLTQPAPIKDVAMYAMIALGIVAFLLNTALAKQATLKRAQENLKSIPRR